MAVRTESAVSDHPTSASRAAAKPSSGIAGVVHVPPPSNEPNLGYLPGSPERAALKDRLKSIAAERIDIPVVIGGREIRTGRTQQTVMPHDHQHVLGTGMRRVRNTSTTLSLPRRRPRANGRAGGGRIARRSFSAPPSC